MIRCMSRTITAFVLAMTVLLGAGVSHAEAGRTVWLLELDGPIGPAASDYLVSSIEDAEAAGVELFVIRIDTPGGLDSSMRDIIRKILASEVPVASWVAPSGARAASAGTYIMYASHIAAMSPSTNIGSSTPVSMGGDDGGPFPMPGGDDGQDERDEGDDATADDDEPAPDDRRRGGTASERKVLEDAVAYIKGLAELRGRNAEWAEETVREASNLTSSEALEKNVIDLIARDIDDLLAQVNGREIDLDGSGRIMVTLNLDNAEVITLEPGWRYEFLSMITNPNIAYILLMIGIYGLILEFYNPGVGVAGVTGIICLLLAAYALQMLPVNYVGLGLIMVGIGLMVVEAFSPSFGVFGIGGGIAFVIGSIILMDTDLPAYQISLPIIAAFAVATLAIAVFALGAALRARSSKVVSGVEGMIGGRAVALDDFDGNGKVRALGEVWQAESSVPVRKGARLRIKNIDGLVLIVEPSDDAGDQSQS